MIFGLPSAAFDVILLNAVLAYSAYVVVAGGTYSFAFIGFVGLGSYVAGYFATKTPHIDTWGQLGIAVAMAIAVAVILSPQLMRLDGIYLALATVSLTAIFSALAVNMASITGGANGIPSVEPSIGTSQLLICVIAIIVVLVVLNRSGVGRAMRLVRADPLLAQAMGVNERLVRAGLFVASSGLAAFGGVLYAHYYQFVSPSSYSFDLLIKVLAMVIIGGSRNAAGPLVGAALMTAVPDWLSSHAISADVVTGVIILLVVLFAPDGIAGGVGWLIRRYIYPPVLARWADRLPVSLVNRASADSGPDVGADAEAPATTVENPAGVAQ